MKQKLLNSHVVDYNSAYQSPQLDICSFSAECGFYGSGAGTEYDSANNGYEVIDYGKF